MKLKTRYRPPKDNIPPEEPLNIPPERDEPPQPSETVRVEFTNGAEPVAAIEPADEATLTLQTQIAHLKKSEELQREFAQRVAAQRAAQMAEPTLPDSPSDRIALWRQGGLSDEDASYLEARPQMVQFPMITKAAYAATLHAGIQRDSPDFAAAMDGNFASLLNRAQPQARPAAADPAGFFRSAPPAASPEPSPSAMYSAPVSRTVPGYREPSPRSVKLSLAEQQIAAASGISDIEYAKNKMRMLRERAAGERD